MFEKVCKINYLRTASPINQLKKEVTINAQWKVQNCVILTSLFVHLWNIQPTLQINPPTQVSFYSVFFAWILLAGFLSFPPKIYVQCFMSTTQRFSFIFLIYDTILPQNFATKNNHIAIFRKSQKKKLMFVSFLIFGCPKSMRQLWFYFFFYYLFAVWWGGGDPLCLFFQTNFFCCLYVI